MAWATSNSFTLPAAKTVDVKVVGSFDSVVEVRQGTCAATPVVVKGCNDNGFAGKNPALTGLSLTAGTYCVIVDGKFDDNGTPANPADDKIYDGEYDLFIKFSSPI